MNLDGAIADYRRDGVAVARSFVDQGTVESLRAEFQRLSALNVGAHRSGAVFGIRDVLRRSPMVSRLAGSEPMAGLAARLSGAAAVPVRSIFFDKSEDANWPLPWHQDRTGAVTGDAVPAEFRNWTVKDGVKHAELPLAYLRAMVTLRLHLDPCDAETGALMVLPGRHECGVIADGALRRLAASSDPKIMAAEAGDTVIMSPLTPHASRRVSRPTRRRVLHIEYFARPLPSGMRWLEAA